MMNELEALNPNMTSESIVANPFGNSLNTKQDVATAQVVSHEVATMQAQIFLAKQFPRDQRQSMDKILTACQRPGLASAAVYSYARGGTNISGPSIRLAEELARNWGNLECGWDELEREGDTSKVRAFAWDKETNVLKTLTFVVRHYRSTKNGSYRLKDERDIYELLANQAARRMRNCILALVPGDVVEAAVEQCQKTMITSCEINAETIRKLVETFEGFGVTKRQIEKRIQRNLESITPAQFVRMREIYTSLRDGMSEPSDWFDMDEEPDSATAATENLKSVLKMPKTAQKSTKSKKEVNSHAEKESSEGNQNSNEGDTTNVSMKEEYLRDVYEATTESELATILRKVLGSTLLNEDDRAIVQNAIDSRVDQIRMEQGR